MIFSVLFVSPLKSFAAGGGENAPFCRKTSDETFIFLYIFSSKVPQSKLEGSQCNCHVNSNEMILKVFTISLKKTQNSILSL